MVGKMVGIVWSSSLINMSHMTWFGASGFLVGDFYGPNSDSRMVSNLKLLKYLILAIKKFKLVHKMTQISQ